MAKVCPKKTISYILAALAFILAAVFNVDVLIVIIGCAVIGLVSSLIAERRIK
jgi:chromate transporter